MFGVWSDEEEKTAAPGPRRVLRKVRPIAASHLEVEVSNSLSSRASPRKEKGKGTEKDKENDKEKDKEKDTSRYKYVPYAEQMAGQFEEAKTRVQTRRKEAKRAAEEEEAARAEERQAKFLARKKKSQDKRRKYEAALKEDAKKRMAQAREEAEQRKEEKVLNEMAAIHAARLRLKVAGSRVGFDERILMRLLDRIAGRRARPRRLGKEVEMGLIEKHDDRVLRDVVGGNSASKSRRDDATLKGTLQDHRDDISTSRRASRIEKDRWDDKVSSGLASRIQKDHWDDEVSSSVALRIDKDRWDDKVSSSLTPRIDRDHADAQMPSSLTHRIQKDHWDDKVSSSFMPRIDKDHADDQMPSSLTPCIQKDHWDDEVSSSLAPRIHRDRWEDRVSSSLRSIAASRSRRDGALRPSVLYDETAKKMPDETLFPRGVTDEEDMSFGGGREDEQPPDDENACYEKFDAEMVQFADDALLESLLFAVKPLGGFGALTPATAADDDKLRQYLRDVIAEQERSDDEAMKYLLSQEHRRKVEEKSDDEVMRHFLGEGDRRKREEETSDDEAMRAIIAEGDRRQTHRPHRTLQEASDDEAMRNLLVEYEHRQIQEASDDEVMEELLRPRRKGPQEEEPPKPPETEEEKLAREKKEKKEVTMRRVFARLGKTYPPPPRARKSRRPKPNPLADSGGAPQQAEGPAQPAEKPIPITTQQDIRVTQQMLAQPGAAAAQQLQDDHVTQQLLAQSHATRAQQLQDERAAQQILAQSHAMAAQQRQDDHVKQQMLAQSHALAAQQRQAAAVAQMAPQVQISPPMIQEGDELMQSIVAPAQPQWPDQRRVPPLPPPMEGEQQRLMLPGLGRSQLQLTPARPQEAHDDEVMQQLLGGPSPLNRSSDLQAMGDETLLRKLSSPDFHLPPRTSADDSALRLDVLSEALALGPPSTDPTPKPGRDSMPPMFGTLQHPPDELDMSSVMSAGQHSRAAEDDQAMFRLLQEGGVPPPAGGLQQSHRQSQQLQHLQQPQLQQQQQQQPQQLQVQPQLPPPLPQPPPSTAVGLASAPKSALESGGLHQQGTASGDDQLLQRLLETSSAQGIGAHFEAFAPQAKSLSGSGSGRRARLGHNVNSSTSAAVSDSLPTFGHPEGCRASIGSTRQSQSQSKDDAKLRALME